MSKRAWGRGRLPLSLSHERHPCFASSLLTFFLLVVSRVGRIVEGFPRGLQLRESGFLQASCLTRFGASLLGKYVVFM